MGKTGFDKWAEKGREGMRVEIGKPAPREVERGVRTVEPAGETGNEEKRKRGRPVGKKKKGNFVQLNVLVPAEMKEKLERIQEERYRTTLSSLVLEIFEKYIRDVESGNI